MLSWQYKIKLGRNLNFKKPDRYTEKLQLYKMYYRNPLLGECVDKYNVRKYIESKGLSDILNTLYGVYDEVADIDFNKLPKKFVLKCTHDSGSVIICKDKSKIDRDYIRRKLNKHLKKNPYWFGREWPYRYVHARIIAEPYLENKENQLVDYKFMCFNGKMMCCFVFTDRFEESGIKLNVYNNKWELMSIGRKYTRINEDIKKPKNYELMSAFAERLAKEIPFVRVDFYEVNGIVYFGEMTFYPNSGFTPFEPEQWDDILGDWLTLPIKFEK